jgi:1-acyl-sn-glycerol-3-phosphate acyltransferase
MRRIARLIGFVAVCLIFLASMILAQPFLILASRRKRERILARAAQLWSWALLAMIGLKVTTHGRCHDLRSTNYLLVSNHQSYLDIAVIVSIFPTLFIAKTEMSRWPLLGWLAKLGGTIFVNRKDTRSGVSCAYRVSRVLRDGVNVQVFPESTTSDGSAVLPFKGLFFASAIRARAPILPLTIKFQSVDGRAMDRESMDVMCWYGEMDFARHFWNLLKIKSAEVALMINEPIEPNHALGAKSLAELARERVYRSFANADAIAAARAEVPIEFARAETELEGGQQIGNEVVTPADFIVSSLLFSLFASTQGDTAPEVMPRSDRD